MKRVLYIIVTLSMLSCGTNPKQTENETVEQTECKAVEQAEHEAVDLGLSVKWATCNLGANTPYEIGDYFAWGETESKNEYTWDTYKHSHRYIDSITKYNPSDKKIHLENSDDAAHVCWGEKWRMPTADEIFELLNECSLEWTSVNGINGAKITGKNGNSIFMPVSGAKGDEGIVYSEMGWYWSNTLYSDEENAETNAMLLVFGEQGANCLPVARYGGQPIRPVQIK